jgi:hypothetical protein
MNGILPGLQCLHQTRGDSICRANTCQARRRECDPSTANSRLMSSWLARLMFILTRGETTLSDLFGKFRYPTAPLRADSADDRRLNRALRELRPERVEITIDRVHLVDQRQDPEAGFYTWTVIEEFPFAAA